MPKITILSSQKPEYSPLQVEAMLTWYNLGVEIVLFNRQEDVKSFIPAGVQLVTPKSTGSPTIHSMLDWYLQNRPDPEGIVMLVNADIRLTPQILDVALISAKHGRVWGATSYRWQEHASAVTDEGLDLFCFPRRIAEEVVAYIPKWLCIGKVLWDNWMNGFLTKCLKPGRYFNLTNLRAVWHTEHDRPGDDVRGWDAKRTREVLSHPSIIHTGIPQTTFYP